MICTKAGTDYNVSGGCGRSNGKEFLHNAAENRIFSKIKNSDSAKWQSTYDKNRFRNELSV